MTGERWAEADRLFREALERDAAERCRFLERACSDDPDLRATVLDLLDAAEEAGPFLEASIEDLWEVPWDEVLPPPEAPETGDDSRRFDRSGERLGPYRLLRRLGRGGMATVYLAERADGQWEQRVAVKILRRGLDTEDVVRRFLAERQILSSLDHPNVARLLDGGSTPDGLPYLVMEYVEGTPIHAYCDGHRLTVDERLALFVDVGRAVQSAHRHLVVHRDLKPSNILVDSQGRVKLLDFGIAKILDPAEGGLVTRTGHRPLTLAYASPEQVEGGTITTASDVYQLGLLLCELLSGRRPYEVRGVSPARAERAITEADPAPPSALVDRDAAVSRATTPDELARTLRGDLDTIALHALRKEPGERYDSAGALVDDVERYGRGEPVQARPDTMGYRLRKFVGRHRLGVGAAAAAVVLLIGLTSVALTQAQRAERERNLARAEAAKTEEVKDLLVGLFQSADPYAPADPDRGRRITVVEALELGAERARTELADRPEILGEVLSSVSRALNNLGQYDRATPVAEAALDILLRAHGEDSGDVAGILRDLAHQAEHRDDRDEALALHRRALAASQEAWGPDDVRTAPFHQGVGMFVMQSSPGESDRARRHLERAVQLYRSTDSTSSGALSQVLYRLANLHRRAGSYGKARAALDEALPLAREAYGSDHPNTAFVLVSEATLRSEEGNLDGAREAFLEALAILESALGEEHVFVLDTWNNYAVLLGNAGDAEGAEEVYRRVVEGRRRALGEDHTETVSAMQNLAANLNRQERYDEAERLLERVASAFRETLGPGHPRTAFPLLTQTEIRLKRGDPRGAERSARAALSILGEALPEGHWIRAVAACRLGRALAGQGRSDEARPRIEEAVRTLETSAPPTERDRIEECRSALAALEGSR